MRRAELAILVQVSTFCSRVIFITLMFYRMPSGLVLYFAVSAIFSITESWYIKRYLIKDPPAGAPGVGLDAKALAPVLPVKEGKPA